jgi:tetratricopeptide (TPR) repeat protein
MPNDDGPAPRIGTVGANIYHMRRKLKITQKQLAAPEFSVSYISAIERGRIRPSLKALDILARRLGVTSSELLAEFPEGAEIEGEYGAEGKAAPSLSLIALIRQHRSSPIPLALIWASISLDQHNLELAKELLDLLTPSALTAEQRLLHLYLLSRISLTTGHPADAQVILEPIFQQDEFSGYAELLARCQFLLACAYEAQEKLLLAADIFPACIQAIENGVVGDPLFAIEVYSALAGHHHHLEQRDIAIDYYRRALSQLDFVLQPTALAETSSRLSQEHLGSAHPTLADWYAARSRTLFELAEARHHITQAASHLGLTLQELGNFKDAEQQLRLTIDLCERLGAHCQAILARIALADLLLERQETQEAERLALEAEALSHPSAESSIEDKTLYGRVLTTLGSAYIALNRQDDAEQCFKQAIDILQKQHAYEHLSHACYRYSELLHQKGQDAESYAMVKQAYLLGQRKHDEQIPAAP